MRRRKRRRLARRHAMEVMREHPDWSDGQVAREVQSRMGEHGAGLDLIEIFKWIRMILQLFDRD